MLRILYGGTFDPVHNGHIAVAEAVAQAYATPVWLIPAADPPHRAAPGASASQRAEMLDLAVAGHSSLQVDRRELARGGASYSIDTLREVRVEIGADASLVWLLGSDALAGLASWKHWQAIFELAHVLAFKRPGSELDGPWLERHAPEVYAEIAPRWCAGADLAARAAGGFASFSPATERPESASEVRREIAGGAGWTHLVPPGVGRYIHNHRLYGASGV